MATAQRIPGLDSLRAYSIIAVVLFHCGLLPFGWAGVWLFFTVSGFVITRGLLADVDRGMAGTGILRPFYVKRFFRIYPVYVLFVLFGAAVSLAWNEERLLHQLPWLLTGTYNLYLMLPGSEVTPLFVHYWSLSVEEHFYLLFPLLLLALSRQALAAVLIGLIVLSPVMRHFVGAFFLALTKDRLRAADAVYVFSLCQCDSIAAGCLLALSETWIRRHPARSTLLLSTLSLIAVTTYAIQVGLGRHGDESWLKAISRAVRIDAFDGLEVTVYSVLAALSALAVTLVITNMRPAMALTDWRGLRLVGRLSFAIYVCHLPLLAVWTRYVGPHSTDHWQELGSLLGYFTLVLAVSYALHTRIELPALAARDRFLGGSGALRRSFA